MRQRYRVLMRMYVEPGDEVILADRSAGTIATLVGQGIIEPGEEEFTIDDMDVKVTVVEVTDGD